MFIRRGTQTSPVELTQEEKEKRLQLVRIAIGDSPGSPFYPLFEDEEIILILESNGWRTRPSIKQAAISASMNFAQMVYRERSGDIEVWNNVSLQYLKALEQLIADKNSIDSYGPMMPYFGGTDACRVEEYNSDPSFVRSPLATVRARIESMGIENCCPRFVKGRGVLMFANGEACVNIYP